MFFNLDELKFVWAYLHWDCLVTLFNIFVDIVDVYNH